MNNAILQNADAFNQDLNAWDTARVKELHDIMSLPAGHKDVASFNGDLSSWVQPLRFAPVLLFLPSVALQLTRMFLSPSCPPQDTSEVSNFYGAFKRATVFDGNVGSWDTARATSTYAMFQSAPAFDSAVHTWGETVVQRVG